MLDLDKDPELAKWLQNSSLSQGMRVLVLLSRYEHGLTITELRKHFASHGRKADSWNFSSILDRLSREQLVVLVLKHWTISAEGLTKLVEIGASRRVATAKAISGLRNFAGKLTDIILRDFVEETIGCLEQQFYRSAIVLSWSGAIWVLQQYVLKKKLNEFNAAGVARFPGFKKVQTEESFGRLQERDILQLLEDIHVIGKSLKGVLIQRLDLRNTCGHPNTVKVSESTAASHVELLIENVFLRFGI